jgi:hypothetical protein
MTYQAMQLLRLIKLDRRTFQPRRANVLAQMVFSKNQGVNDFTERNALGGAGLAQLRIVGFNGGIVLAAQPLAEVPVNDVNPIVYVLAG